MPSIKLSFDISKQIETIELANIHVNAMKLVLQTLRGVSVAMASACFVCLLENQILSKRIVNPEKSCRSWCDSCPVLWQLMDLPVCLIDDCLTSHDGSMFSDCKLSEIFGDLQNRSKNVQRLKHLAAQAVFHDSELCHHPLAFFEVPSMLPWLQYTVPSTESGSVSISLSLHGLT